MNSRTRLLSGPFTGAEALRDFLELPILQRCVKHPHHLLRLGLTSCSCTPFALLIFQYTTTSSVKVRRSAEKDYPIVLFALAIELRSKDPFIHRSTAFFGCTVVTVPQYCSHSSHVTNPCAITALTPTLPTIRLALSLIHSIFVVFCPLSAYPICVCGGGQA